MKRTYKIIEDLPIKNKGRTLYRIVALVDIPEHNVYKGDMGGYVESYDNLQDNAWIFDHAQVYDEASVYGNAKVFDYAQVYGHAKVSGYASVYGHTEVCGNAQVMGEANVYGNAKVSGYASVFGSANVHGNVCVYDYVEILGDGNVYGNACVSGNARITQQADYIVFKNDWSSGRYFTWTRSNNMWKVGCFYGTGEELIEKAYKDSKRSGNNYKAIVDYVNNVVIPQDDKK